MPFQTSDTLNLQRVKTFSVPPVTLCGLGAPSTCGQEAQTRGLARMFIVADSFLYQAGMTVAPEHSLAMKGAVMTLWPRPIGEPCIADVCTAVAQLRESKCGDVMAFGGGSVLDAARAVTLLVTNPTQTLAGIDKRSALRPCLPPIAVSITVGMGSETMSITVIIDVATGLRRVLAHTTLMPDVAILDVALIEGVPAHVVATAGIDTPTHIVEAYSALNTTLFTDGLATDAMAMIGKSLPRAVGYGQDLVACGSMLLASCMAGVVFFSVGPDLCHVITHQPGAVLHIPYGQANVMLLPMVVRLNRMVCCERFNHIGRASINKKSDDRDAIDVVSESISGVGRIKRLSDARAKSEQYSAWAYAAPEDICIRSNPCITTQAQIIDSYAAAGQCSQAGQSVYIAARQ